MSVLIEQEVEEIEIQSSSLSLLGCTAKHRRDVSPRRKLFDSIEDST